MRGIVRDSLAEMLDRKIFWVFGVLTLVSVIVASLSRGLELNVQTNDPMVEAAIQQAHVLMLRSVSAYLSFLIFLAVMASASVIPTMLERGRVDFYLSKPVSRESLLLSKLLAVWLVYGAIVILSSLLVYGTIGAVQSAFEPKIFLLLAVAALQLLIWLCITFAAGIFTGSTSMAVVTAFLVWIVQFVLGAREAIKTFFNSTLVSTALDGLYYVVPKSSQMADLGFMLAIGGDVSSWLPLWSSLLFAAILLLVTLAFFRQKDY